MLRITFYGLSEILNEDSRTGVNVWCILQSVSTTPNSITSTRRLFTESSWVGYLKASLCLESNHRAYVIVKGHETSTRQYQVLMLCILLEDKVFNKANGRVGEMARWFRALAALAED